MTRPRTTVREADTLPTEPTRHGPQHSIQTQGRPVVVLSIDVEYHTSIHNNQFKCLWSDPIENCYGGSKSEVYRIDRGLNHYAICSLTAALIFYTNINSWVCLVVDLLYSLVAFNCTL